MNLRRKAGKPLAPALIAAYRATRYRVEYTRRSFDLQVDVQSPALFDCHNRYGVDRSVFLTAWNPHSRRASPVENDVAEALLESQLGRRGYTMLRGYGIGPSGSWPPEKSVLVLGLDRASALDLGRKFRQAAILYCGRRAIPRLLLLK